MYSRWLPFGASGDEEDRLLVAGSGPRVVPGQRADPRRALGAGGVLSYTGGVSVVQRSLPLERLHVLVALFKLPHLTHSRNACRGVCHSGLATIARNQTTS